MSYGTLLEVLSMSAALGACGLLRRTVRRHRYLASRARAGGERLLALSKRFQTAYGMACEAGTGQCAAIRSAIGETERALAGANASAEATANACTLAQSIQGKCNDINVRFTELLTSLTSIHDSSAQIEKMSRLVDEFAFQTTILALNATIQAAHAGPAGAAFSIVAAEMKQLADRIADAAAQITNLSGDWTRFAALGCADLENLARTFGDIAASADALKEETGQAHTRGGEEHLALERVVATMQDLRDREQPGAVESSEFAWAARELSVMAEEWARTSVAQTGRKFEPPVPVMQPSERIHILKQRPSCARAAVGALLVTLTAPAAQATDGYFSDGYGTPCKAMAGACIAAPLNGMSVVTNPAAAALVHDGYDAALNFFAPFRDFTVQGSPSGSPGTFGLMPGTFNSDKALFFMPSFSLRRRVGESAAFAFSLYGNGGMNTTYNLPVFGTSPTGVDLEQLFVTPTYARLIHHRHAIGVTAVVAYQRFAAQGLAAFAPFSSDPSNLTNRGHSNSFGGGARVGYLGVLNRWLSVGGSYQTKTVMSPFEKYKGLFAEGGKFDIPPAWRVGAAVRPISRVQLNAEVDRILYGSVPAIANPMFPNFRQARLGDTNGPGFGWHDVTIGRAGIEVSVSPGWILRGGVSFGEEPVKPSEVLFNILAPGVIRNHVAFGVGRALGDGRQLHVAVVRANSFQVSGFNPLESPGQQRVQLRMDQWEVEIGLSFRRWR